MFEDTKGVIRSREWEKDRQYNGQEKKDKRWSNYYSENLRLST